MRITRRLYISSGGIKGKNRTAFELKNKGIDKSIIKNVQNDDEKELENCICAAKKFIKNKPADNALKQKLYRHLLYRGFEYNTAQCAAKKVLKEDNSQDSTDTENNFDGESND